MQRIKQSKSFNFTFLKCASQDPGNTIQSKHHFADPSFIDRAEPSVTLLLPNGVNCLQKLEDKLTTEKVIAWAKLTEYGKE